MSLSSALALEASLLRLNAFAKATMSNYSSVIRARITQVSHLVVQY